MPLALRHQLCLLVVAGLVFFVNLGRSQLWDEDEPKNAQCAREMFERGDWITPTFNQALRYDKPALVYWLMISAYRQWGINEFAARFWSAVLAVGTTLATYHIGRMLFGARVGFWAGWMMATSLLFVVAGRAATPDSALIFCTTLAMLAIVRATWGACPTLAGADALNDYLPKKWRGFALVYAALAVGVLAKGPVAVIVPMMALGCFLLCVRQAIAPAAPNKFSYICRTLSPAGWIAVIWKLRPLTALLVVAAIALPWYLAVGLRTEGDWLSGFFGQHNFGRFLNTMEGHRGPLVYYLPAVLFGFFPWSVLLPAAVWQLRRRLTADRNWAAYLFAACWAGVWIGFFSLSATKLPSYALPAYPALALLAAAWLEGWLSKPEVIAAWLPRMAFAMLVLVGGCTSAVLLMVARRSLPGDAWIACVGTPIIIGGVLGFLWSARRPRRAAATLAACSLAFAVLTFGFGAPAVSRHQNSAALTSIARRIKNSPLRLATFDYSPPSLLFYAGNRVEPLYAPDEVARYLGEQPEAMVVCDGRGFDALKPTLPEGVEVVARQRRFLRSGDVLLLGRRRESARRETAGPRL